MDKVFCALSMDDKLKRCEAEQEVKMDKVFCALSMDEEETSKKIEVSEAEQEVILDDKEDIECERTDPSDVLLEDFQPEDLTDDGDRHDLDDYDPADFQPEKDFSDDDEHWNDWQKRKMRRGPGDHDSDND